MGVSDRSVWQLLLGCVVGALAGTGTGALIAGRWAEGACLLVGAALASAGLPRGVALALACWCLGVVAMGHVLPWLFSYESFCPCR